MKKINRRDFIRSSAVATASAAALPLWAGEENGKVSASASAVATVIGANSVIRYAVVGFNGRGADHLSGMAKVPGTRLVALCDVDSNVLDRGVKSFADKGQTVQGYTDIRKLLENKDVDAITIATPNHWHSLAAIWAIQAGKDVYVEKPVSHNVSEGRRVVRAARKYGRIVQTGTQCRSSTGLREAIAWLHEGNLGKIIRARGLCYKRRASIGKVDGPQPVPASIDYDLWCGPAPKEPLMRKRLHYDWHWVWPTGNGDLGNQGIHQMDIARWVLGEPVLSPRVWSVGGRLGYEDDGTTPNTLIVYHDYKAAPLIFEVRGLPATDTAKNMDTYHGASIGVVVDCEGGSMVIPSYTEAIVYDKEGQETRRFKGDASHYENFIQAVLTRKQTDLNADILEGHISSALCHTGNISYRLGATHSPEEISAAIKDTPDLAESVGRMEEHLAANSVNLHSSPATLGAVLKMDPGTERFLGNEKANQMLTREYRDPFVVPEKI